MKGKEQGFTLIELVIVIVILGILSAFALPRFADLGGDARQASIEGAAGSVASAASIAHSAWLADGGEPNSLDLEGVSVDMSDEGYPIASRSGIGAAAQLDENDFEINTSNGDGGDKNSTIKLTDGPNDCDFKYLHTNGTVLELDQANCE